MQIIEWLLSALAWLQIFISPVIIGVILGLIIWLNIRNAWGLSAAIIIALIGCRLGIAFAEKARRSKGTIEFMSRNIAHPELLEKELTNEPDRIK
jgi:FtsH-binding integral membrane protein